ncbi:DUF4241 domain-containing protein [Bacillus safensis]|uniref:DUF4241 domain-containing protein n=1 Tax=Bacillus TaxID=1386 RepID=UPI0038064E13
MTSGHIVACDSFVSEGDQSSFTRKVTLGKYPILLVVKRLENGYERSSLCNDQVYKRASNIMGACYKSRAGTQSIERK